MILFFCLFRLQAGNTRFTIYCSPICSDFLLPVHWWFYQIKWDRMVPPHSLRKHVLPLGRPYSGVVAGPNPVQSCACVVSTLPYPFSCATRMVPVTLAPCHALWLLGMLVDKTALKLPSPQTTVWGGQCQTECSAAISQHTFCVNKVFSTKPGQH